MHGLCRIETLTNKLKDRLRPFVELKNPDDTDDPERRSFEEKMRKEVDDLKYESFGVEVSELTLWVRHRLNYLSAAANHWYVRITPAQAVT